MPDSPHRSPLTLEDLLRLKRAERPSSDFWVRFESELRQKQLAALLERRPWWQNLSQLLVQRRAFVPLGATAILAFTLVTVRFYSPVVTTQATPVNSAQNIIAEAIVSAPVSSSALTQPATISNPEFAAGVDQFDRNAVVAVVALSDQLPERAADLTPWSASLPVQSASAKFLAANSVQPVRSSPDLNQAVLNNPLPLAASRLQRSSGAIAELASVSAMTSKRTRLMAQYTDRQFTPESQAPAIVRERITRHLAYADTSNIERFTRLGLKGDQVSLRF